MRKGDGTMKLTKEQKERVIAKLNDKAYRKERNISAFEAMIMIESMEY
jgi:hypothetical protein